MGNAFRKFASDILRGGENIGGFIGSGLEKDALHDKIFMAVEEMRRNYEDATPEAKKLALYAASVQMRICMFEAGEKYNDQTPKFKGLFKDQP